MKTKYLYLEVLIEDECDKTIVVREQKETNLPPVAVAVCSGSNELIKFIDEYE